MAKHSSEDDQGDQRSQVTHNLGAVATPDAAAGLYRAADERDACGVGFIAHIKGHRSPAIVRDALTLLVNLEHRGAAGSDPDTGDGAGILIQMPDRFLRGAVSFALPPAGAYGAGLVFLPRDTDGQALLRGLIERIAADEGHPVLGWREVPANLGAVGRNAAAVAPAFAQVFIGRSPAVDGPDATARFERALYVIRKRIEQAAQDPAVPAAARRAFYIVSLSTRTLTYKGMLTASQLGRCTRSRPTPSSTRRWPWCTSASRPTRSRRGRWPTRTATSPTTARSTPCRATSTGCAPARACCSRACSATTWPRCCR